MDLIRVVSYLCTFQSFFHAVKKENFKQNVQEKFWTVVKFNEIDPDLKSLKVFTENPAMKRVYYIALSPLLKIFQLIIYNIFGNTVGIVVSDPDF